MIVFYLQILNTFLVFSCVNYWCIIFIILFSSSSKNWTSRLIITEQILENHNLRIANEYYFLRLSIPIFCVIVLKCIRCTNICKIWFFCDHISSEVWFGKALVGPAVDIASSHQKVISAQITNILLFQQEFGSLFLQFHSVVTNRSLVTNVRFLKNSFHVLISILSTTVTSQNCNALISLIFNKIY